MFYHHREWRLITVKGGNWLFVLLPPISGLSKNPGFLEKPSPGGFFLKNPGFIGENTGFLGKMRVFYNFLVSYVFSSSSVILYL